MKKTTHLLRKTFALFMLGLLLTCGIARAQQDPMFTQYMFNTASVNPAYVAKGDNLSFMLLSRHQWIGFDGAPMTQTFTANMPIKFLNSGVGLSIVNDKIGPVHNTGLYIDYAYQIQVTKNSKLAMGLKSGISLFGADISNLGNKNINDPSLISDIRSRWMPNFGFGLYYYSDRYFVGVSTPKLVKNDLSIDNGSTVSKIQRSDRHYFILGGYLFDLTSDVKFRPSFMIKKVKSAPTSVDLTAMFIYKERFWGGLMYRGGDSFGALIQVQLTEYLRAGYSYDQAVTKLSSFNYGTHEIMISYDLKMGGEKIISPRFF